MYIKAHTFGETLLVAICDRELIGQTLSDGALTLEVSEFFYKGEISTPTEVRDMLKRATSANLVGRRATKHALEGGFITEDNMLIIGGVPYAQMMMADDAAGKMSDRT